MMDQMMGQMWGCGGAVALWLLFVAVLVVGVVLLVRALTERSSGGGALDTTALRILEERFARGEIDRDEFEERRRTLRS